MLVGYSLVVICLAIGSTSNISESSYTEDPLLIGDEAQHKDKIFDFILFLGGRKKSSLYGLTQLVELLKNRVRDLINVSMPSCKKIV